MDSRRGYPLICWRVGIRQTGQTQNLLVETPCGFDPRRQHQLRDNLGVKIKMLPSGIPEKPDHIPRRTVYERMSVMRKKILISGLFCLLIFLQFSVPAYAYDSIDQSQEKYSTAEALTHEPYSLADLAAARLAAYKFLPEEYRVPQEKTNEPVSKLDSILLLYKVFGKEEERECPFYDVPDEYKKAVAWAYENGIVYGVSNSLLGSQNMTRDSFEVMIQRLLGNEFCDIDTSPIGSNSDGLSLGDTALIIQEILLSSSLPNNIPKEVDQIPFPFKIQIIPQSLENATLLLEKAYKYLPNIVIIERGPELSEEDFLNLFKYYREIEYGIKMGSDIDGSWFYSRIYTNAFHVYYDCHSEDFFGEEFLTDFENSPDIKSLKDSFLSNEINSDEYSFKFDIKNAETFGIHTTITLRNNYTQSWEMICDEDNAFCHFANHSISAQANSYYQRYCNKLDGLSDYDTIMAVKKIIVDKASYGSADYPTAHQLAEFFNSGRIVCDAYAETFQYFMLKENIPCIFITGSSKSKEGVPDHAWNKVQLDGKWYNMDICWADTGGFERYDLKSDAYYSHNSHWPNIYKNGTTAALESYEG